MNNSPSIKENIDISEFNTMGVAAKARYFVSVKSLAELKNVLSESRFKATPKFMLGGGSNVLFLNDFDGLIIHMNIKGREVVQENEDFIFLKIGAGENWHELVMYCVKKGWGGVENLSLIPGSVGAAPIQNIGAYGVELEDVFEELEAIHIKSAEVKAFSKSACKFGYRDSIFKNQEKGEYVITSVTLRLRKSPLINISYKALSEKLEEKGITNPGLKDISKAVVEIRKSKLPDPAEIGNTGSFFKNPVVTKSEFEQLQKNHPDIPNYTSGENVKVPAAWLIDQCGWKGKRFGDAGVHKMQALVIVNYGNATGKDIWELAEHIQKSVKEKFGVALTPEVNIIG